MRLPGPATAARLTGWPFRRRRALAWSPSRSQIRRPWSHTLSPDASVRSSITCPVDEPMRASNQQSPGDANSRSRATCGWDAFGGAAAPVWAAGGVEGLLGADVEGADGGDDGGAVARLGPCSA